MTIRRIAALALLCLLWCGLSLPAGAAAPTKKGLQGTEFLIAEDVEHLNVGHVLINMNMADYLSLSPENAVEELCLDGQPLYVTGRMLEYQDTVRRLNARGIKVTAVLLLGWPGDPGLEALIAPSARKPGMPYYGWNVSADLGGQAMRAMLGKLAELYGRPGCRIDNWIVGNEVNCPNEYHYTGLVGLTANTALYAAAVGMTAEALAAGPNPDARVYLSLQHNWARDETGSGYPGRDYLDSFAAEMERQCPEVVWNVAAHPYAAVLDSTKQTDNRLWFNERTTRRMDSLCVTAANLTLMTDYIRDTFGPEHRVILSEQGFDSITSQNEQAAFFAYTYYAAERNEMVDAVIFRTYLDFAVEPQRWGMLDGTQEELQAAAQAGTKALKNYIKAHKRQVYDVFKYMDTGKHQAQIDWYLGVAGISGWEADITPEARMNFGQRDYPTVYAGVDYAAVYDRDYYLSRYPDTLADFWGDDEALLAHFVTVDMPQGVQASPEFDLTAYRLNYPPLAHSFREELPRYYLHYIQIGRRSGWVASQRSYVLPDTERLPSFD